MIITINNGNPSQYIGTPPGGVRSPVPGDPLTIVGQHQVLHVAIPVCKEEAVLVVWEAGIWPVVAVVAAHLITITGIQTVPGALDGHQVVQGPAPASARACGEGGGDSDTDQ